MSAHAPGRPAAPPRADAAGEPREDPLEAACTRVREAMGEMAEGAAGEGMPRVDLRGQLIRPVAAYASARVLGADPWPRTWAAALAVQLAHEASLVHDDIVDGAATRRGEPALVAAAGVGAALVAGDHLLAWAYRMAARTGSLAFAELFAEAVERTVAGERAQGKSLGRALAPAEYEAIALDKAGALLGCAVAAAPAVIGRKDRRAFYDLGRALGLLYQRLDDLLDYCPAAATGKPALGDHAQRRWTWVFEALPASAFDAPADRVLSLLHAPDAAGATPLRRLLARLEAGFDAFDRARAGLLPGDVVLARLAEEWRMRARSAVRREEAARGVATVRARVAAARRIRARVPAAGEWRGYMARNSRSFSFAARFFPPEVGERVARVYAWCRVTDDLVDRAEGEGEAALGAVLDEWAELSRRAYAGGSTGLELVDRTMGEMASAGIPFAHAAELVEGMRMDLRRETYPSFDRLRVYTRRVASVVGLWLTELSGVRDAATLRRAEALGHAMQLTNILRDVGEDGRAGRLYLPADLMRRHGVDAAALAAMGRGASPVSPAYAALVEELMRAAEADYAFALAAVPRLPAYFQRPVAVAGWVYRGIHGAIRRNGYDNLRLRARTGGVEKAALAARALWELRRARRAVRFAPDAKLGAGPFAAGGAVPG